MLTDDNGDRRLYYDCPMTLAVKMKSKSASIIGPDDSHQALN